MQPNPSFKYMVLLILLDFCMDMQDLLKQLNFERLFGQVCCASRLNHSFSKCTNTLILPTGQAMVLSLLVRHPEGTGRTLSSQK